MREGQCEPYGPNDYIQLGFQKYSALLMEQWRPSYQGSASVATQCELLMDWEDWEDVMADEASFGMVPVGQIIDDVITRFLITNSNGKKMPGTQLQ